MSPLALTYAGIYVYMTGKVEHFWVLSIVYPLD